MNKLAIAAFAACLGVSASAQDAIHVSSPAPTFDAWMVRTTANLSYAVDHTATLAASPGVTYIAFECSEDGKPINVRIAQPGNPWLDKSAMKIVRNMKSLHPLYAKAKKGQVFEAAIVLGTSQVDLDRNFAKVNDRARKTNAHWASLGMPNPVVSLAMVAGF